MKSCRMEEKAESNVTLIEAMAFVVLRGLVYEPKIYLFIHCFTTTRNWNDNFSLQFFVILSLRSLLETD